MNSNLNLWFSIKRDTDGWRSHAWVTDGKSVSSISPVVNLKLLQNVISICKKWLCEIYINTHMCICMYIGVICV